MTTNETNPSPTTTKADAIHEIKNLIDKVLWCKFSSEREWVLQELRDTLRDIRESDMDADELNEAVAESTRNVDFFL